MLSPESLAASGRDTAHHLLLTHLWANMLRMTANPEASLKNVSDALLANVNDAPAKQGAASPEDIEIIRQYTLQELEDFWRAVELALPVR